MKKKSKSKTKPRKPKAKLVQIVSIKEDPSPVGFPLVPHLPKQLLSPFDSDDAVIVSLKEGNAALNKQVNDLREKDGHRVDEINRLQVHINNIEGKLETSLKTIEELKAKSDKLLSNLEVEVCCRTNAENRLKKIAESNFGIAKCDDGKIVLLNAPPFKDFLAVQATKQLSLYEAACQIEDQDAMLRATDAIGKANTERNEVAVAKYKDRVIQILSQQKKEQQ